MKIDKQRDNLNHYHWDQDWNSSNPNRISEHENSVENIIPPHHDQFEVISSALQLMVGYLFLKIKSIYQTYPDIEEQIITELYSIKHYLYPEED